MTLWEDLSAHIPLQCCVHQDLPADFAMEDVYPSVHLTHPLPFTFLAVLETPISSESAQLFRDCK